MASPAEEVGTALGRHMTVEFYECNSAVLADAGRLREIFVDAAKRSGATVIDAYFHEFKPQGVSGVVVISESHFAVHAWPEHDYAAVDLFTCGDGVNFDVAIREIAAGIGSAQWIASSMMHRGIVGTNGVERLVPVTEGPAARYHLSWKSRFNATGARGLSAAIDIYECSGALWDQPERYPEFVWRLAGQLGSEPVCEMRFDPPSPKCFSFEQPLRDGRFAGRVDIARRAAYFDLILFGYFEPREAAEFLIGELGGRYYRLMPQIRQ